MSVGNPGILAGRVSPSCVSSSALSSARGISSYERGHRAFPDPHDDGRLYITTFGGSVWHGPRDGVPSSVIEDLIPWAQ